jgi:hypothetical protein
MALGSVSLFTKSHMTLGAPVVRKDATTAGVSRFAREQQESLQIEFLARRMATIRESLTAIRKAWSVRETVTDAAPATAVATVEADFATLLQDLPGFGAVTAGTLLVNGESIAVDPAADTLADIGSRITNSAAGASAGTDESGRFVRVKADDPAASLVLDDNGTGLLAALGLPAGRHQPSAGDTSVGLSAARSREVAKHLRTIYTAINEVFDGPADTGDPGSWMVRARGRLQSALEKSVKDDDRDLADDFGLDVDFADLEESAEAFLPDGRRLELGLQTLLRGRAGTVEEFLFGNRQGRRGLVGLLETNHDAILENLTGMAGNRGISLDRFA